MALSVVFTGFAATAALIVAIGAQNAFVLRQGLRREHVPAVVTFCIAADLLLIGASTFGLANGFDRLQWMAPTVASIGAIFLGAFGLHAWHRAAGRQSLQTTAGKSPQSLQRVIAQLAGFTWLNPHVYLDTALIGTIGAQQPADARLWFVAGAALASSAWFASLGFGCRWLAPWFARPMAWRVLDALVGATMIAMAVQLARYAMLAP